MLNQISHRKFSCAKACRWRFGDAVTICDRMAARIKAAFCGLKQRRKSRSRRKKSGGGPPQMFSGLQVGFS
jgi:hypothetical protein